MKSFSFGRAHRDDLGGLVVNVDVATGTGSIGLGGETNNR